MHVRVILCICVVNARQLNDDGVQDAVTNQFLSNYSTKQQIQATLRSLF